jgi:hypothetical protein
VTGVAGLTPAQQALLAERLRGRSTKPGTQLVEPIAPAGPGPAPLSAEQEQLYYHGLFAANPLYNEAVTITKDGPFDPEAFRTAFNQLVARHTVWHSTFQRSGGSPTQVVGPAQHHPLPMIDLSDLAPEDREQEAVRMFADEVRRRYDLRRGPLVRPLLVRFDDSHHRLYLGLHHLIFDGVSLYRIILPELASLYDAAVSGRVPAAVAAHPTQYVDYASWQAGGVLEAELARNLPYWRERLADAPTLALPLDHPRGDEPSYRGAIEAFRVSPVLTRGLQDLADSNNATLFHVIAAAFTRLLQGYSGQDDVVFATVADRRSRPEFETMVGYCLTPVVMRVNALPDSDFSELIQQVRGEILDALGHLVPFERLVRDLDPPHLPGATPLFQAMLVLEPQAAEPPPGWNLHQLDARIAAAAGHGKVDFHLELDRRPDGALAGRFIFNPDLFDPDFGQRVVRDWFALLDRVIGTA